MWLDTGGNVRFRMFMNLAILMITIFILFLLWKNKRMPIISASYKYCIFELEF